MSWFVCRNTWNSFKIGIGFNRYTGKIAPADPTGSIQGWDFAIYLGAINIAVRHQTYDGCKVKFKNDTPLVYR